MTRAIVLAGGRGKKIWPYDEARNKVATPVMNVPNVRRLVDSLVSAGIGQIAVAAGHQEGSVRSALEGSEAKIAFYRPGQEGGTNGAVLSGWPLVASETIAVAYGDVCCPPEAMRQALAAFASSGAIAGAVVCKLGPNDDPRDWIGAVVSNGEIGKIEGHSTDNDHRLAGLYFLTPQAIAHLEANPGRMESVPIGGMPPSEPELAQSIQLLIEKGEHVQAIETQGFWIDLDKPWHILEANRKWLEHEAASLAQNQIADGAQIDDSAEIDGFVSLGKNARIGKRAVIKGPLFLGEGAQAINGAIVNGACAVGRKTVLKDYCLIDEGTVIGATCIVGHGAEMDGAMFDGAYLYHYCEISGVVGEKVDIGAATVCGTLRFDDGETSHWVQGRRETPSNFSNATYFGDYSRTGVNVITLPGRKIGAYSCVGPGVIVTEDVPNHTLLTVKQELVQKEWGPEKYGW